MAHWPQFVGPAYATQSAIATGERLVNWYPARLDSGGKSQLALYPTPGFESFATLSSSPGRGIFSESGRCFAVYGSTLYEIASDGTPTSLGTVSTNNNPVYFISNGDGGDELFLVSGNEGYVLDLNTNILTNPVSAVDFCGLVDGFFVALDPDTSTLKISESLDGSTWDPTQIAQRTSSSDPWKAMAVVRREIFLLGEKSGEVWYNSGASPFPFARRLDVFFEYGIKAPHSLTRFSSTIAWLGSSALGQDHVYWLNGYTPEKISSEGVDWAVKECGDSTGTAASKGWSYESEGHQFYVLELPNGRTWVYDLATRMWHERGHWEEGAFAAYRARYQAVAFNKNLVCDHDGSVIYNLSPTAYSDVQGGELRRLRVSPHMFNENMKMFFDLFELEADTGVTPLLTGQGSNPELMLRYSNSGGKTWGPIRRRSVGAIGEYDTRIRWEQCGSGRDRVWELSCSDPAPVRIIGAYVKVRGGRH